VSQNASNDLSLFKLAESKTDSLRPVKSCKNYVQNINIVTL